MSMSGDSSFHYVDFDDTLEVEYELDGETLPYCLEFTAQGRTPAEVNAGGMVVGIYLMVRTTCFYSGAFELGGEQYRFMLGDANGNGSFSDTLHLRENVAYSAEYPIVPAGDQLYLSRGGKPTHTDRLGLGNLLVVGTDVYDVKVDTAARRLTLTPRKADLVPLKLATAPERMELGSRDSEHTVMMLDPGEVVKIPAGEYRFYGYMLRRTGELGDEWTLTAGATAITPFVSLDDTGEATLEFGEPFVPLARISEFNLKRMEQEDLDEVPVDFDVEGRAKELLKSLSRVSGPESAFPMSRSKSNMPLEPTYTVYEPTGEMATQGQFEYG